MKVNGIDIRTFDAKLLTVDIQPPSTPVKKEWNKGFVNEFDTDQELGSIKLQIYFRGEEKYKIEREMSKLTSMFSKSCDLELEGYKGTYKGYMISCDYKKTISDERKILNVEFEGYFYDSEIEIELKESGAFERVGTRVTPCSIEVLAKVDLVDYQIKGLGEDIIVKHLRTGEKLVIDGRDGTITKEGNAFEDVDIWELPKLKEEHINVELDGGYAEVKIKYNPMWI